MFIHDAVLDWHQTWCATQNYTVVTLPADRSLLLTSHLFSCPWVLVSQLLLWYSCWSKQNFCVEWQLMCFHGENLHNADVCPGPMAPTQPHKGALSPICAYSSLFIDMEYENVLVLLFFHAISTVNNSKFEHSVMKRLWEAGLQGCCFVGHVTPAFGTSRWDTDGFLCNEAGLPLLWVWLLLSFGFNLVFSDWAKLQLTSIKRLAWLLTSAVSPFKVITSQASYACGGKNSFRIGHWNKSVNCSQAI